MSEVLKVEPAERFARFNLISWWDQERLARAKVVVIGAGALGNEIVKNLALLGAGNVFIADRDTIENSNLSRSVLYRAEDCGRRKAEVAASRARDIYPGMRTQPFHGNVVYDLGQGIYRWADVIFGALDNREARVAINQAAARAGKIWIDGAIERLDGVARVFQPASGPCYECTMSDVDWKMLEARRSCALLSRQEMEEGKVPTTPTTASVIAGIQTQEAVKFLHGLEVLAGQGFVFDGTRHESYVVRYTRKDECPSHEEDQPVELLDWKARDTQIGAFLDRVRSDLGPETVVELHRDLLASLYCSRCDEKESLFSSLGKVTEDQGRCPNCEEHRAPEIYHAIDKPEPSLADRTLQDLGVAPWDVVSGRNGLKQRYYELQGDRDLVLGCLGS
jgi:molybdopterin/thiamine biosynthesis adenylyltransferase